MKQIRRANFLLIAISLLAASFGAEPAAAAPKQPWVATGQVLNESGEPMAGVDIVAHTGMGTLLGGGRTMSGSDGTFELHFGPGIWMRDGISLQAATISARKTGWFETNLYRQGDLLAAFKLPAGEIGWGKKSTNDIFLPGEVKELTFVMARAGEITGRLLDADGAPLKSRRVGLTGEQLPPSSSVFAEVKTDEEGTFAFQDVPTTFSVRLYAESPGTNWRQWPAFEIQLGAAKKFEVELRLANDTLKLSSSPPLKATPQVREGK